VFPFWVDLPAISLLDWLPLAAVTLTLLMATTPGSMSRA
jgi:hypothetical protein